MHRRKILALAEVVVAAADKEETPVPLDNPPHHPAAQVARHLRKTTVAPKSAIEVRNRADQARRKMVA